MQPAVRAIADKVAALAFAERDEIERMYPKVLRRVGGYNLDIFFPQSERPYTPTIRSTSRTCWSAAKARSPSPSA